MDKLDTLALFLAVADNGSFTRAAQGLGCSPTAASRAIAGLETQLGTSLFRRSTRQVALTEAGIAYRDRVRPLLMELKAAARAARADPGEPRGELHITAPTMFGRLHVVPVLADLMARFPQLAVRLLLIDRNIRLAEEGIDVAVRIGALADSSLTAVRIATVRQVIVASPAYLARRGVPADLPALARHDLIATSGPRANGQWRLGRAAPRLQPRLSLSTVAGAVAAAEAGIGLASLLSYQVADALADGRLVEILPGALPERLPVHLVFDGRLPGSNGRRPFIDAMKAAMLAQP